MSRMAKSGQGIYADKEMRSAVLFAKLVGELMDPECPKSYNELAEFTGLHVHTVRRFILAFRENTPRVAYIAGWGEDCRGNRSIRLFALGSKHDVPRPKLTQKERNKRRWKKIKAVRLQQAMAASLETLSGLALRPSSRVGDGGTSGTQSRRS